MRSETNCSGLYIINNERFFSFGCWILKLVIKMKFHKLFDSMVCHDGNADSGLNINTLMHLFCRCICWRDNLVWPHTLLSLILSPHSRSLFSADIDTLVVLFLQNRTTYITVSILANLLLSMSVLSFHSFCQMLRSYKSKSIDRRLLIYILCIMDA